MIENTSTRAGRAAIPLPENIIDDIANKLVEVLQAVEYQRSVGVSSLSTNQGYVDAADVWRRKCQQELGKAVWMAVRAWPDDLHDSQFLPKLLDRAEAKINKLGETCWDDDVCRQSFLAGLQRKEDGDVNGL